VSLVLPPGFYVVTGRIEIANASITEAVVRCNVMDSSTGSEVAAGKVYLPAHFTDASDTGRDGVGAWNPVATGSFPQGTILTLGCPAAVGITFPSSSTMPPANLVALQVGALSP
jgi:hypothetical protein